MLEFLLGFLVVIPLIPLNDVLVLWAKKDPTKTFGIITVMFGLNMVILLTYGFLLKSDEPTIFILGLLGAILVVMIRKIKSLI
jgi:multisubunit Na+/H+ antiporter MnhG subunit